MQLGYLYKAASKPTEDLKRVVWIEFETDQELLDYFKAIRMQGTMGNTIAKFLKESFAWLR